MAEYTEYITIEGDRWDTVAWKAYGDPMRFLDIADANPKVPLDAVIPSGTKLMVPVIDAVELDTNLLPPWKR